MKRIAFASILVLSMFGFTSLRSTTAQEPAPTPPSSASGNYKFILADDYVKSVEFDSRSDEKGNTSGRMTFTDEGMVSHAENDGDPDPRKEEFSPFYMTAEFDRMTVEKNRALMSGKIVDSSHMNYLGKWVQLVVEDNALNPRIPDKISWTFCQPPAGSWIPEDAEVKGDNGAYLTWWATDAERKDDVGIASRSYLPSEWRGCEVRSLWVYEFAQLAKWDGDIIVSGGTQDPPR